MKSNAEAPRSQRQLRHTRWLQSDHAIANQRFHSHSSVKYKGTVAESIRRSTLNGLLAISAAIQQLDCITARPRCPTVVILEYYESRPQVATAVLKVLMQDLKLAAAYIQPCTGNS